MTRSRPLASEPRQTHSQMERSVPPGRHSQDPANVQLGTEHDGTFGRKSRPSLQDGRENKVPAHGLPGTSVKKRHRLGVYTTDSPPGSGGQTSKVKVAQGLPPLGVWVEPSLASSGFRWGPATLDVQAQLAGPGLPSRGLLSVPSAVFP